MNQYINLTLENIEKEHILTEEEKIEKIKIENTGGV